MNFPAVQVITSDACVFGMKAVDASGAEGPVKKPTRWMGNAPHFMKELNCRCGGRHGSHVPLLMGGRQERRSTPRVGRGDHPRHPVSGGGGHLEEPRRLQLLDGAQGGDGAERGGAR